MNMASNVTGMNHKYSNSIWVSSVVCTVEVQLGWWVEQKIVGSIKKNSALMPLATLLNYTYI